MSIDSFGRARRQLNHFPGLKNLALLCGGMVGALYLGWMLLLIPFADLLLHPEDDAGLLHLVASAQNRWFGRFLEWFYHSQSWTHHNISLLQGLLVCAILLEMVRLILLYTQNHLVAQVTTGAISRLGEMLLQHNVSMGGRAFDPRVASQLDPMFEEKLPTIHLGLKTWLDVVVREPIKIVLLLLLVLSLNLWLGLSFLLMAALVYVAGRAGLRRTEKYRRSLIAASSNELSRLLGVASKLRLIKGYAAEDYFRQQYENRLSRYRKDTLRRMLYEGRVSPLWQALSLLIVVVVVILGGQNVLSGKFVLSSAVGVYASLLSLALPASRLVLSYQIFRDADEAALPVFEYLIQPARAQREGTIFLPPLTGSIDLKRVTYKDERGTPLINDLSIRIHAGQRIALMAKTDAERLAFVYLLTRMVQPNRGSIKIDGKSITDVTLESLRSQISLVLRSDLVFPETVMNNIGCGDPGFGLPQIIEAAKGAHAHHFIQHLPHGYDCMIGETGFPLNIGEKFRIALARAILRDSPIVVLEEPKESTDADTNSLIDDTMARFLSNRTLLLLPVRPSTLRWADQIFLLEDGKLLDCGTYRELFATSSLFRKLECL